MKISVAQLNYTIGDFKKNSNLICNAIRKSKTLGADIVVFSELSVSGYPPLDLLDRLDFVERCADTIKEIAHVCQGIAAIVGAPVLNNNPKGKKLYNSALLLYEGNIIASANKSLLPTYDIFDEYRYFEPEKNFSVIEFMGKRLAITICEDLWDEQQFDNEFEKSRLYSISPSEELARQNPDVFINLSASPFSYSKIEAKENIFASKAARYGKPVFMVNQTGANTELIFEGGSMIFNSAGALFDRLPYFDEDIRIYDLEEVSSGVTRKIENENYIELMHNGLVTGVRDYFKKSGLNNAILGLSGGIDSAVTLCIAVKALGKDSVRALLMPSRYSSDHSVNDSIEIAERLGVRYDILSIEQPLVTFESLLKPLFEGRKEDLTEENLQARIRAILLMAVSNKFGAILLNTSNKSEASVGYGTLYGDMAGGLSVIGDVYKTDVYRIANFINSKEVIIPQNILDKLPSAELRADQLDSDSLPDYAILDTILYKYIEQQKDPESIVQEGADREIVYRVIKMINSNEFKRYQSPPVLRISSKAFGSGRRMPLVARY